MAWNHNGPVSVPPTPLVGFVAFLIAVTAIASVGLGLRASWRDVSRPAAGEIDTQASQAIAAQPIVELGQPPQQQAAPAAPVAATNSAKEIDTSDDIAAKTAAVQAAQSKPAQGSANPDDILTSSSEKPQAPAKPSTDEVPPSGPPKTDVPF